MGSSMEAPKVTGFSLFAAGMAYGGSWWVRGSGSSGVCASCVWCGSNGGGRDRGRGRVGAQVTWGAPCDFSTPSGSAGIGVAVTCEGCVRARFNAKRAGSIGGCGDKQRGTTIAGRPAAATASKSAIERSDRGSRRRKEGTKGWRAGEVSTSDCSDCGRGLE
jgi:hypothetical protein